MRKEKGFTLIELLIVVAIIGIIAAIAIPNLLNAIQRGKQKRTMGDLRTSATAIEAYAVDNNAYPTQATQGNVSQIATHLEPTYIKAIPTTDGWNNDIEYQTDAGGTEYTLGSSGKDGSFEKNLDAYDAGTQTTAFDSDIVFSTGSFIQWPEGTQQ